MGSSAEEAYLRRLERDIEAQSAEVAGRMVHSVFFGGGTPSLFPRAPWDACSSSRAGT